MKVLKVLLIDDGKPGHSTQSEGLVHYLRKHFIVEKEVLRIKPRIKVANRLLRYLLNNNSNHAYRIFSWFYVTSKTKHIHSLPHLIISTGGNTCGVNAVLAQKYNCSNFFLGSLRKHKQELFTAVITTAQMPDVVNSITLDIAPNMIDPDNLDQAGKKFMNEHNIPNDKKLWSILIGGDGSGYHYSVEDYENMAKGMLLLAKRYDIRWLVTTSRRTQQGHEQLLKTLLDGQDEITYSVFFNENPEKTMLAFLGAAEMIFCTEDSTSMVSEAVISQKPVFTLYGSTQKINAGHMAVISKFSVNKYISRIKIEDFPNLSPYDFEHTSIEPGKNYDKILGLALASIRLRPNNDDNFEQRNI
jgi:hypothetical protein